MADADPFVQPYRSTGGHPNSPSQAHAEARARQGLVGEVNHLRWASDPASRPAPPQWLVEGLIPRRVCTIFAGNGSTGKSYMALTLAIAVASGKGWLDKQPAPGRAIVFSCEDDESVLAARVEKICTRLGVRVENLDGLCLFDRVGLDNDLVSFKRDSFGEPTATLGALQNKAVDFAADLVVIDSRHDTFSGNEIDRQQTRLFLKSLTELAREDVHSGPGRAVVLLDHPSREGLRTGDGQSGSTAWFNAARSFITLARNDDGSRTLKHKKNNWGNLHEDIRIEWSDGIFARTDDASTAGGQKLTDRQEKMRRALSEWRFETDQNEMSFEAFGDLAGSCGAVEKNSKHSRKRVADLRLQLDRKGIVTVKNDRIFLERRAAR